MKKYIIGVDLGGTKIATAIADTAGKIIYKINTPTEANLGKNVSVGNLIKAIYLVMDKLKAKKTQISKIGIGAPGPILHDSGLVVDPPNLPGWGKLNLKIILKKEFGTKIILENDAKTAALGEAIFGAGKKYSNLVYITIGTGIGGGIIIDKKIYRGSSGAAGEIGHTLIELSDSKIRTLESLAAGPAIAKAANMTDGETVYKEAVAGNAMAINAIECCGQYIGLAVANIINILNPEIIIIGGGISKMGKIIFDPINETAKKNALPVALNKLKIVPAKLGVDAGLIGAIALCL